MTLHASSLGRGHRDDRRRRLLSEDLTANSSLPAGETPAGQPKYQPPTHKSENYGDSEFLQTQARLTDLVPRRLVPYLLCLKGGLAIIAGLMAFYVWAPKLIPDGQPASQLADLGKCGSLGNWFASLLLLMATALAGMIFSVRRHKVDDYRGHYRVWLWVATAWFLAATDAAANLHQGFQQLMVSLTSWRLAGEGSLWWVGAVLLFAGPIGFRLFMDMRSSRLSTAALLLAATAYLTALTAFFHGIVLQGQVVQRLLMEGSLLGRTPACDHFHGAARPLRHPRRRRGLAQTREKGGRHEAGRKSRQEGKAATCRETGNSGRGHNRRLGKRPGGKH